MTEQGRRALPRRGARRRLQPARRDVPRRARTSPGFPRERVLGMAGILDTARFSTFVAWETGDLGQGRPDARPRRPRRPDGAARERDPRRRGSRCAALVAEERDRGDDRAHREGRRRDRRTARHLGLVRARAPRPPRSSTRSCSTRSACSPAPPSWRASTGSTGLYVGVPVRLGAGGVEEIVELELDAGRARGAAASADAVADVVGRARAARPEPSDRRPPRRGPARSTVRTVDPARPAAPAPPRHAREPARRRARRDLPSRRALALIPSSDYIFLPDRAHPVAPLVDVAGGHDPRTAAGSTSSTS